MDHKLEITRIIDEGKTTGHSFAFVNNTDLNEEMWLVVNYVFHSFEPEVKCSYNLEKVIWVNRKPTTISSKDFGEKEELIASLLEEKANPLRVRAVP